MLKKSSDNNKLNTETVEEQFKRIKGIPQDAILLGDSGQVLSGPIEENVESYIASLRFYIYYFLEKSCNNNELIPVLNSTPKEEFEGRLKIALWGLKNDKHRLLTTITNDESENQLRLKESAYRKLCSFQEELLKLAFDEGIDVDGNIDVDDDGNDEVSELQRLSNMLDGHLSEKSKKKKPKKLSKTAKSVRKKYAHRPVKPVDECPECFTSKKAYEVIIDFKENHVLHFWKDYGYLYHRSKANGLIKNDITQKKWFEIITEEILKLDDDEVKEIKNQNAEWRTHFFGSEKNLNFKGRPRKFKTSFEKSFPDKDCEL